MAASSVVLVGVFFLGGRAIFFPNGADEVTSGGTGDVAIEVGARRRGLPLLPACHGQAGGLQPHAARYRSNTTQHPSTPAINTLDSAHGPNPIHTARIHTHSFVLDSLFIAP